MTIQPFPKAREGLCVWPSPASLASSQPHSCTWSHWSSTACQMKHAPPVLSPFPLFLPVPRTPSPQSFTSLCFLSLRSSSNFMPCAAPSTTRGLLLLPSARSGTLPLRFPSGDQLKLPHLLTCLPFLSPARKALLREYIRERPCCPYKYLSHYLPSRVQVTHGKAYIPEKTGLIPCPLYVFLASDQVLLPSLSPPPNNSKRREHKMMLWMDISP